MKIGYARISTDKQETKAQEAELLKYGCPKDKIFFETLSGASTYKPQLKKALEQLREGDELVVWKLDRLSRSLKDLLFVVDKIRSAKATFTSLTEHLDTKGPAGEALMPRPPWSRARRAGRRRPPRRPGGPSGSCAPLPRRPRAR